MIKYIEITITFYKTTLVMLHIKIWKFCNVSSITEIWN